MSDGPCCAHLRVSYRTELFDAPGLVGMTKATRGWWECDSGCGAKFLTDGAAKHSESETASAAFKAGFEAGREVSAKVVETQAETNYPIPWHEVVKRIRALAVPEDGGGG